MKNLIFLFVFLSLPLVAMARDDISDYSVEEAMAVQKVSSAIGEGIRLYFAGQKHSAVIQSFGEFQSNKKTNAFGKSDKEACQWAFASAMKSLKERAVKEGGNAVINIRSNYRGNQTSSNSTFKCGAGTWVVGVALIGDVVKL